MSHETPTPEVEAQRAPVAPVAAPKVGPYFVPGVLTGLATFGATFGALIGHNLGEEIKERQAAIAPVVKNVLDFYIKAAPGCLGRSWAEVQGEMCVCKVSLNETTEGGNNCASAPNLAEFFPENTDYCHCNTAYAK